MKNLSRILLLLAFLMPLAASAADTTCHQLMTEKECAAHKALLEALPSGEARDRYLAEFNLVRTEREAACRCNHTVAGAGLGLIARNTQPRF